LKVPIPPGLRLKGQQARRITPVKRQVQYLRTLFTLSQDMKFT